MLKKRLKRYFTSLSMTKIKEILHPQKKNGFRMTIVKEILRCAQNDKTIRHSEQGEQRAKGGAVPV